MTALDGIRLVTWDVDGTLYRMSDLNRALRRTTLRRLWTAGPRVTWAELRDSRAHRRRLARQRGGDGRVDRSGDHDRTAAALARYVEEALTLIRPNPKAIQLLDVVAAAGLPQVALSDLEPGTKLATLGLADRFVATYACEALGWWKPSPLPFRHVQAVHGVRPDEHLHVGDREDTDGEGARRAGCRFHLLR